MFVPMSDLMKEEDFFNMISGQQREVRSVSRSSSRSDRTPLYMNTTSQQPTYQNHFFDTEADWWLERERERQGAARHLRVSTGWEGGAVHLIENAVGNYI